MNTVSDRNFGLLIAYLVPGFTALWGVSYFSETLSTWLNGSTADGPTIGGFLDVTLAAVASGMTVSTIRRALIDTLHHATGIKKPDWDFAKLQQHCDAYDRLETNHYRFYQFYAAMVISLFLCWGSWRISTGLLQLPNLTDLAFIVLIAIFFAGSPRRSKGKLSPRLAMLRGKSPSWVDNVSVDCLDCARTTAFASSIRSFAEWREHWKAAQRSTMHVAHHLKPLPRTALRDGRADS